MEREDLAGAWPDTTRDAEKEADDQIAALNRLRLAGWAATAIGDPGAPEMLIYLREKPGFTDSVLVNAVLDAEATRKDLFGTVLRKAEGNCVDVVGEVLSW